MFLAGNGALLHRRCGKASAFRRRKKGTFRALVNHVCVRACVRVGGCSDRSGKCSFSRLLITRGARMRSALPRICRSNFAEMPASPRSLRGTHGSFNCSACRGEEFARATLLSQKYSCFESVAFFFATICKTVKKFFFIDRTLDPIVSDFVNFVFTDCTSEQWHESILNYVIHVTEKKISYSVNCDSVFLLCSIIILPGG